MFPAAYVSDYECFVASYLLIQPHSASFQLSKVGAWWFNFENYSWLWKHIVYSKDGQV